MIPNYAIDDSTEPPLYNVVAYITAYQDRAALHQCIQAIKNQTYPISQIVIVDNSPISLLETKRTAANELVDGLIVWAYPQNIGISGGLQKLIRWAVPRGYHFVWMFDQDSEPAPNCLSQLILAYAQLTEHYLVGIVAPISIDPRTQLVISPAHFLKDRFEGAELPETGLPYECESPITSGSLLLLASVGSVPPPDDRLFIDGIDLEHGLRLTQAGYKNFVVTQAAMNHSFGYPIKIKILGRTKLLHMYSALRYYYICRNHTYLELKFSRGIYKFTCSLRRLKFLSSQIFWLSIMRTENRFQKMWACLRGTYFGFRGDLDQQYYGKDKTSP